jgi:hypothetical protein
MRLIKILLYQLIMMLSRSFILMANPQTTEVPEQVLTGAAMITVSLSANMSGSVDIGAANGVKITEDLKISTWEIDNCVDRDVVTDQKFTIEFDQLQMLNEPARVIMRGSLDTVVPNAGTIVSSATQLVVSGNWHYNDFIPFANQNGDGSAIAITSITGATDGALVAETDYFKVKLDDGTYGIIVKDSATVTTQAQNLTFVYDYTPNASIDYFTGGKTEVPFFYMEITNENEEGDLVVWRTLGKCNITKGDEILFQKYNADDPRIKIPVSIVARQDITLDAGKNLMRRRVTPS